MSTNEDGRPEAEPQQPQLQEPAPVAEPIPPSLPERAPRVTVALLAVMALLFVAELVLSLGDISGILQPDIQTLVGLGGSMRPLVLAGDWWRLFTSTLLHADLVHLVLNGICLFMAGVVLEQLLGHARTFVLFVIGGLGGSLLSLVLQKEGIVSIGASGAVMAMLTCLLVLSRRIPSQQEREAIQGQALRILVPSLIPLVSRSTGGEIDYAGHVGGALTGLAVGGAFMLLDRRGTSSEGGAPAKALAWTSLAVMGLSVLLGARYFPGHAVAVGIEHARPGLLALTCATGKADDCNYLGYLHDSGQLVAKDVVKAAGLYERACTGGDTYGCKNLGLDFMKGVGVPEDPRRATELFEKGCGLGLATSCSATGRMYSSGLGVAEDGVRAAAFFERGCEGGDAQGCSDLGVMYGLGQGVAKDEARAASLYERACEGGDMVGCTNLALMYDGGSGVKEDPARAASLVERACAQKDARGCFVHGLFFQSGRGVAKDEARAAGLFEQACEGGLARGCAVLGEVYRVGQGVAPDEARALGLFQRACEAGDAPSCEQLPKGGLTAAPVP